MPPTLGKNTPLNVQAIIESKLLIQANSGGGKSWAVRRVLEQTYSSVPQIVIDPEGEFHTLREKYEYALLGQKGGDGPADVKSAGMLARRLLELNVSAIVDIYELGVRRQQFVKLFCEALVNAPKELWHPVLIVLDEAHVFCPESGSANAESLNAVIDLMTRGRKRGFGVVLATQRIASLHKSAAAECNTKMIGRTALDVDIKRAAKDLGFTTSLQERSLKTLLPGTFYAYGPALSPEVRLITVGAVTTTHPRAGERAAAPTPPGPKVRKILGQLADLPKEAEAETRSLIELRIQVRELTKDLADARKTIPKAETKTIERSVIKPADLERLIKLGDKLDALIPPFIAQIKTARRFEAPPIDYKANEAAERALAKHAAARPKSKLAEALDRGLPRRGNGVMGHAPTEPLPKGPVKILEALIQYPNGLKGTQIVVLTGYKATSVLAYTGVLINAGYADRTDRGTYRVTPTGIALLPDVPQPPTGSELQAWHLSRIPKGEAAILEAAIAAYPSAILKARIEEVTGYKPTSILAYTGKLAARELLVVERGSYRASEALFD